MIKAKNTLENAKNEYYLSKPDKSIGIYQEKAIHAILKNYFEIDNSYKEVKYKGKVCDIKNDEGIIEIQTRNYNALRDKLDVFLETDDVTIVYPLLANKTIIWLNSENEKDYNRKSTKHQTIYSAFKELYKIKKYLDKPNLHFHFVFLDAIEFKNLDGYDETHKKRASSINKFPIEIKEEIDIENYKDYYTLFKNEEGRFSVKTYAKSHKQKIKDISVFFTVMSYLGIIKHVANDGKAYIYEVNKGE